MITKDDTDIAYRDGWNAAMSTKDSEIKISSTKVLEIKTLETKYLNGRIIPGLYSLWLYKCEHCQAEVTINHSAIQSRKHKFCPNCGAKIISYKDGEK